MNKAKILQEIETHCPNAIVSNRQRENLAEGLAGLMSDWTVIESEDDFPKIDAA